MVAVALLSLVMVLAVIGYAAGTRTNTKSTASPPSQTGATTGQIIHNPGQTAHTGDFDVTVVEVRDPFVPTNPVEQSIVHGRLIAAHFAILNTAGAERTLATYLNTQVTDAQNHTWRQSFAGSDLPHLDGNIEPGATRDGWIVFDVGQDATGLQLRMKGDITSTGTLFQLSP